LNFIKNIYFLIRCSFVAILAFVYVPLSAQSLPVGFPVLEEELRREQLVGKSDSLYSFTLRPLPFDLVKLQPFADTVRHYKWDYRKNYRNKNLQLKPMPLQFYADANTHHPYLFNNGPIMVNSGMQLYASAGVFGEFGPFSIQLQPEYITGYNRSFRQAPVPSLFTEHYVPNGEGFYNRVLPGQSSLRVNYGAFSLGLSTENIWWGPGQFNALTFTNNTAGFAHITLNTRKPAKTFMGNFEGQLIMGRLTGENPTIPNANVNLLDDWRYLNALMISYQPKWIPGLYVGGTRTFQQYNSFKGNSLIDFFPVVNPFQKERTGFDIDSDGRDQQASVFVRYMNVPAQFELYFEYGRRDHAVNWREFLVNPEHARAYLIGFMKLFPVFNEAHLQVRGEMLQQQESINVLARYGGVGINWAGHNVVRHGFTHRGQMLGPSIGPGSNVQTLEAAWVKGTKKLGMRMERLNRHQDRFIRLYRQDIMDTERQPWVDLSMALLGDWQFDRLLVSSQLIFSRSLNYQWERSVHSHPLFPVGIDKFNIHGFIKTAYMF
jgi:hypothetical protein